MKSGSNLLYFLLLSQFYHSQFKISGSVFNEEKHAIPHASVQLLQKDSAIIDYCFADINGFYELKGNTAGKIIKYSALNYQTQFIDINATQNFNQNVQLANKEKLIQEIIIFSAPKVAKVRSDSISFNLKAIRDHTERTLGDLIQKLPGLEIDGDGKVNFQGARIDELLIDGKEFFGNKHQMATQNITAEMVDGLDLLLRHQTDNNKKDFNLENKTVLNVKLKEKYKGEIIGNIALYGGFKNKFLTRSNFFKFSEKGNISWISNANAIGESPMSVEDYLELTGVINKINSSSDLSSSNLTNVDEFIPKYIYTEEKVREKINYFSALNYAYKISNTFKINGNTIINKTHQTEQFDSFKKFFTESGPQDINEEKAITSKNLILSSYLNLDLKPIKKLALNYNILYNPSSGNSQQSIKSGVSFENHLKTINNNFVQNVKITHRYNENLLLTSSLSQSHSAFNKNIFISADQPFLGLNFNQYGNQITEEINLENTDFGFRNSLILKHNKDTYQLNFQYQHFRQELYSKVEDFSAFLNDLNATTTSLKYGFSGRNYFSFFQIQYGFNINSYKVKQLFPTNTIKFEPNLTLTYELNMVNKLGFSYFRINSSPSLFQTLQNNYVEDYQTIIHPAQIELFQFSPSDNFQLSYLNFNPKNEESFRINLNYIQSNNTFSTNTDFSNSYATVQNVLVDKKAYLKFLMVYDKKFAKIPLSLKSNLSLGITESDNYIQDLANKYRNTNIAAEIKIISHFKNSKFQTHFNYLLNQLHSKQYLNDIANNLIDHRFTLHILGVFKHFNFDIENVYLIQTSNTDKRHQFLFSPSVYYFSKNNKWEIGLKSQNVFQLENNLFLTQSVSNYYLENNILYTIPGNLLLGIKYNL